MKKKAIFVINLVSGTSSKAGVPNLIEEIAPGSANLGGWSGSIF